MKFRILAATLIVAGLAACSSNPDKVTRNPLHPEEISQREQRLQAAALYAAARDSLDSADYDTAIQRYTTLATRFPFTDYAIQGELEKVYAEYRAFKSEDRKSVVSGKSVSVRVDLGGRRSLKKKNQTKKNNH